MSGVLFLPGKSELCKEFFSLIENKFFDCGRIRVCVESSLLHYNLCDYMRSMKPGRKLCLEIETLDVYDAVNFDKDTAATGKKIAGPAVCKMIARSILSEMDLGFNGADEAFVDAVYDSIKFLCQNNAFADGEAAYFPSFCSVGAMEEFIRRWKAYWRESGFVDFFSCLQARINRLSAMCEEGAVVTLNLSPQDKMLRGLMSKAALSRGMAVFSGIDVIWVNKAASKEDPYFCHKQFLDEVSIAIGRGEMLC